MRIEFSRISAIIGGKQYRIPILRPSWKYRPHKKTKRIFLPTGSKISFSISFKTFSLNSLCFLLSKCMEICKLQGQILERVVQADFDICKRNLNICVRISPKFYFGKRMDVWNNFHMFEFRKQCTNYVHLQCCKLLNSSQHLKQGFWKRWWESCCSEIMIICSIIRCRNLPNLDISKMMLTNINFDININKFIPSKLWLKILFWLQFWCIASYYTFPWGMNHVL